MVNAKANAAAAAEAEVKVLQRHKVIALNTLALMRTFPQLGGCDWQATARLELPAFDAAVDIRLPNEDTGQWKFFSGGGERACKVGQMNLRDANTTVVETVSFVLSRDERAKTLLEEAEASRKDMKFFQELDERFGVKTQGGDGETFVAGEGGCDGDGPGEEKEERSTSCIICLEDVSKIGLLPCGHHSCEACMRMWVHREKTCPQCRRPLSGLQDIRYVDANKKNESAPEDVANGGAMSNHGINGENNHTSGSGSGYLGYTPDAALVQTYGTKPAAVLQFVRTTVEANAAHRVLIFSKFDKSLIHIADTFRDVGLPAVRCGTDLDPATNVKAIARYTHGTANAVGEIRGRENETTLEQEARVLLLPCEYAGTGTNLQCTTHVVFLEPPGDNAQHTLSLETQCIGRADRIGGRTEPVSVHYFLMEDTVEEKIFAQLDKARRAHAELLADAESGVDRANQGMCGERINLLNSPSRTGARVEGVPPAGDDKRADETCAVEPALKKAKISPLVSTSSSSGHLSVHPLGGPRDRVATNGDSGWVGPYLGRKREPVKEVKENCCPCCGKLFRRNDTNLDVNRHVDACLQTMM